jgi:putative transposase
VRHRRQRYFEKSIDQNGEPQTITIDKSGSKLAALEALTAQRDTPIKVRQNKYLNNIDEQDHRAISGAPERCLDSRHSGVRIVLGGIELMRMIKKGQVKGTGQTAAEQFYSLAT